MRLSQIARKLGATQSTLVELLTKNGFEAPAGGYAKLNEEQVTFLYKHYDITVFTEPEELKNLEEAEAKKEEETTEVESPVGEVEEEIKEEEPETVANVLPEVEETPEVKEVPKKKEATVDDLTEENHEEVGVIRAKKVKLDGIKVLGKIELPEPKVKEPKAEEEEEKEEKKRPARTDRNRRNFKDKRRPKRTLTFEEKQKIEERNRLKEKEEREKKLKEKKKEYFEKNIKPKQKANELVAKKKKKKKEAVKPKTPQRTKLTTKNPLKRFWQWLNDPYA